MLLLRLTQKRFSATQYALFSSLFGLPRLIAGPVSGFLVDAVGWQTFFLITLVCGIPGMVLLSRFAPFGVREPTFTIEAPERRAPLSVSQLTLRGAAGGLLAAGSVALLVATLSALKAMRGKPGLGFDLGEGFAALFRPAGASDWLQVLAIALVGTVCALFTAAVFAARHGAGRQIATLEEG